MLNTIADLRLTAVIALLPILFLSLVIQRAEAQDKAAFPYEWSVAMSTWLRLDPAFDLRAKVVKPT